MVAKGGFDGSCIRTFDLSIGDELIKKKMWYGSINYMGYATEEECAVRFSDEHLTAEMLDVLYGE